MLISVIAILLFLLKEQKTVHALVNYLTCSEMVSEYHGTGACSQMSKTVIATIEICLMKSTLKNSVITSNYIRYRYFFYIHRNVFIYSREMSNDRFLKC